MKLDIQIMWLVLLAAFCFWAFRCSPKPDPIQPQNDKSCAGACAQGALLGCSWAGQTCESWCGHYHAVGYMRPWAECVSMAGDVLSVKECGVSCK